MQAGSGDGLWRWLLGGLAAGAVVLGLMVGAYYVGFDRGTSSVSRAAPPTPPVPTETTPTKATGGGSVARGKDLFTADACAGCHSLDGSKGIGPTIRSLAGSEVKLADGRTVIADEAYLQRSIDDPDAEIVAGYQKGVMSASITSFDLAAKPADVAALVAFMESKK